MSLRNKKILITAGPTWVSIDNTRVISNIASGKTGILLAQKLRNSGAGVTLLLGPVGSCCLGRNIKLLRFKFFAELERAVRKELKSGDYDILIHSAAVSDYRPRIAYKRKLESGRKKLKLDLVPTPKIIDLVKKLDKSIFLVGFKFEAPAAKDILIKKAKALFRRADLDLAVANTICGGHYQAYIINKQRVYGPLRSRQDMANRLIALCREIL